MMHRLFTALAVIACLGLLPACGKQDPKPAPSSNAKPTDGKHVHADGSTHDDHAKEGGDEHKHHDDEVALGSFDIQGIKVEAAQGHGKVEPGKEGHLVIKLPYNDAGKTTVRAWIGTEDRTASTVGKGEYAPSHDDYDIHAVAPDPLPEGAKWWVEIEKPDGIKAVGSFPYMAK